MSFFGLFGGDNDAPKMPNMGELMIKLTKYMALFKSAGKDKQKVKAAIGTVVADVATEGNIKMCTGGLIGAIADLQQKTGCKFVIDAESTTDNQDVRVRIWTRSPDNTQLEPFNTFYLSQINQADFHTLINLIFNERSEATTIAIGPASAE